jgi:succinyl-diaminopimelate desuccinylase
VDNPTLELARELIARRSVTPDDAGCQQLIARRLAPIGFRGDPLESNGVTNVWLRRGDARPLFCFAGHTDVVPPGPRGAWRSDPFVPTERDGWLYGRGAADMKGSLAAFTTAVETFVARHPDVPGSIALLLTSDEEGPATDGTVKVVERLAAAGETIDYCVVGEPSSDERLGDSIKIGRRGTLSGTLIVNGVQGHVAYPHLAKNPIHAIAPAIVELVQARWDEGTEHFPPTAFQCSNIHAGAGATNVIPGSLELWFNFRYSTASTRASLEQRLRELLARHGIEYTLAWTATGVPYYTPKGRLVDAASLAIESTTGAKPRLSCAGGTSDGRFIASICPQVVELGPVNATIHKIDERVRIDELDALARVYAALLERVLVEDATIASEPTG